MSEPKEELICEFCEGDGWIYITGPEGAEGTKDCEICGGTGRLPSEP